MEGKVRIAPIMLAVVFALLGAAVPAHARARVDWSPRQAADGAPVRLTATGLRPRRRVTVALAGRVVAAGRASRTGRYAATIRARAGAGTIRQGATRLRFTIRPAAAAASDLTFPVRAAFYYPWFPEAWNQSGLDPFTHFTPDGGLYDSGASATIARHLDELRYAGVQVAITSWWGQGHPTDRRLPALLDATRAAGSPVRWAVYYEPEGQGDPSVAQLASDLAHLRDRYAADPAYARVGGRFVVFAYGDAGDSCATADRWRAANAGIGAYVVLKVVPGYRGCPSQPDGWHQYAPAQRTDDQPGQSFSVSPGFWLASDPAPRLARDPACFRGAVRDMVASRAPWQLVTTFDEWGEGTAVEPARQWATPSGYGAYLDALHDDGASGPPAPSNC
jgi:hypothetical protein